MTGGSRFLRACLKKPVDRPPVWFLRQAGRYMAEYREVRKHHTLVEICKRPELAAEVTITAAEKLGVDAAIIFADLLLPLEPMGLDFEFVAGEGPMVHHPLRTPEAIDKLRVDRTGQLEYVAAAIAKVAGHFGDALGMIGFCGAPFTLASYMIEGGSSRNYIFTKQMMYAEPYAWQKLLDKLVTVLTAFAKQQVDAGADVIQIFDSWVGSLSVEDYRDYVLPVTTRLVRAVRGDGRTRHLLRCRDSQPAPGHARNQRGRHRPRLAHPARRRLASLGIQLRGPGQSRPHYALRSRADSRNTGQASPGASRWPARTYF